MFLAGVLRAYVLTENILVQASSSPPCSGVLQQVDESQPTEGLLADPGVWLIHLLPVVWEQSENLNHFTVVE